jgi:hypothetical protein
MTEPRLVAVLDSVIAALLRTGFMAASERFELAGRLVAEVRVPLEELLEQDRDDGR